MFKVRTSFISKLCRLKKISTWTHCCVSEPKGGGFTLSLGQICLCLPTAATVITIPPGETQGFVGSSVTFTCVAEAEPTPTFQWSFEGLTVMDDDMYDITATTSTLSTLTVLNISPSDDGTYTCNATNDHGSDFASAELQVLCKLQAECNRS